MPSNNYTIRTTVFENGERMPLLVSMDSGCPVFNPCIYATTVVRPNSGSSATIEQALRSVKLLLTFTDQREINLSERFDSGRFLDLEELDDLVRTAYSPSSLRINICQLPTESSSNVISFKKNRERSPGLFVSHSTVALRIYYVASYMEWLGHRSARKTCKSIDQKSRYMVLLKQFLELLRARTPRGGSASRRMSLTTEQKAVLIKSIDPANPEPPWDSEFVRDRNRLIIQWGLGTGLRRGELLGIRIKLIDFRRNIADIIRRPDDKKDPRKYQPNTKTRERAIGISEQLAYLTHQHIVKYRSKIQGAQKHDFLFVAEYTGRPLSLSGFSKIFSSLRKEFTEISKHLSSHVLRHTWNESFSEAADKAGLSPEEERRARNHAMGWSDHSNTADVYLKRRTSLIATETSIKIQQGVIGDREKYGKVT